MKGLTAAAWVAIVCTGMASPLTAQVPANKEPHHSTLVYNNDLRILELVLPVGQAAAEHGHEFDMVTLGLSTGTAQYKGAGQEASPPPSGVGQITVAEHTGAPGLYTVEDTGGVPYRVFEIENTRESGWPPLMPLSAPGTSVARETRAFTVYDVRLSAETQMTHHEHTRPTVVVLLEGEVEFSGVPGQDPMQLRETGRWVLLPRFQVHDLAVSDGQARVIEIEVH